MFAKYASPLKKINEYIKQSNDLNLIRKSGLFDENWYLAINQDVAQTKVNPLLHYLNQGGFEGRDPGPNFSSKWYLDRYGDVKKAGLNPLIHYLKYGFDEGREARPWRIDLGDSYKTAKRPLPPDFLIVGAQKAGTTALYSYLSLHPGIIPTSEKEHHFFNCEKNYIKGPTFYQSLFPPTSDYQLTFDASPGYLADHKSPARIHNYNPNIKIIVLLRNPIDRAYSAWQMYRRRYENNRDWFYNDWVSFCDKNSVEYKRRSPDSIFSFHTYITEEIAYLEKQIAIEAPVINHGFYAEQLERYFELFERDQILTIHSDELRLQTGEVLKKIQDFIGLRHYKYNLEHLAPVFEGRYTDKMERRTRSLLTDYYKLHNENLYRLLGTRFEW